MDCKCCLSRDTPKATGLYSELALLYERACKEYPDLSKYDKALQVTLKGVMDGVLLGKDGTDESPSLSFDSLTLATACILDANNNAAQEILANKEDIWSHKQLHAIVEEYFNLSSETLKFLHDLQGRLSDFQDSLGMLRSSFQQPCSANTKALALERLQGCEGFTPEFHSSLNKVIMAHTSMLRKLQEWRNKSKKGIHILRRVPKVMCILLVTVFVCAVVCSILVAALHAPPLLVAIPAAAISITSWNPLISWVEDLWKSSEERKLDLQIAEKVGRSNYTVIHELRGIEISVKALMDQKKILEGKAEFIINAQDDVFILSCRESVIDRSGRLIEGMVKLDDQVTRCCRHIEDTRSQILEKIKAGTEPKESCCVSYCCHM